MTSFLRIPLFALVMSVALWGAAQSPAEKAVAAELVAEHNPAEAGKPVRVAVALKHQDHHHMYGKVVEEGKTGLPTKVTWKLPEGWKAEELPWPATKEIVSTGGEKIQGYEGTVYLPFKLTPPAGQAAGSMAKLEATIKGLLCNESSCMPVTLNASLDLTLAAEGKPTEGGDKIFNIDAGGTAPGTSSPSAQGGESTPSGKPDNLGLMLVFAFLGGLILNIMPCVFPVLGIKITSIVKQTGDDKKQIFHHGLIYTLGVVVSFWVIVALLQIFNVSWGGQFQNPLFVYAIVLLFTVFGLNMAGMFEIGTSAVGVGSEITRKSSLKGSFFTGLLTTLVSTPCSAPMLAPALVYGLSLSLLPSLLFFTVIGLGLAFPFLLLSMSPGLLKKLPRPGAWMESFKQAMSFLMVGAALFFAWTLLGQVSEVSQRDLLLGLVAIAMGLWVYGRWCSIAHESPTRMKGAFASVIIIALGVWWSWPQPKDLSWKEWSAEKVASLHESGTPVYVDYTARWCLTCQMNKRVYKDDGLKEAFAKHGVVLLKADWTNDDPAITKALAGLNRAAIPVNTLHIPGRKDPVILPELLTVDNVKAALAELDKTPTGNKVSSVQP